MQDVLITINKIHIIPQLVCSLLTPSDLQANLVTMAESVEAECECVFFLSALKPLC